MNKFAAFAVTAGKAFVQLLKTYPALAAAVVNAGVIAAGWFGLHVSPADLVYYAGVTSVLLGLIVHMGVVPLTRAKPKDGS